MKWDPPLGRGIQGYHVYYTRVNEDQQAVGSFIDVMDSQGPRNTVLVIGGLAAGTSYRFQVAAYNGKQREGRRSDAAVVITEMLHSEGDAYSYSINSLILNN